MAISILSRKRPARHPSANQVARAILKRSTGQIIGSPSPITAEDWPYQTPLPGQLMWRYLDLWKFERMLEDGALYFSRADKFEDKLEGKFGPDYSRPPSVSDAAFAAAYGMPFSDPAEREAMHERIRRNVFVSCWHMADRESPQMWDRYTTSSMSVAVRTTANALERFVGKDRELLKSCVKYHDPDFPRSELSHLSLFLYKPEEYAFEKEYRLIRPMNAMETVVWDDPADFGRNVPIRMGKIIKHVFSHPSVSLSTERGIQALLKKYKVKVKLQRSSLA